MLLSPKVGVFGAEGMEYGTNGSLGKRKRGSAHLSIEVSKVHFYCQTKAAYTVFIKTTFYSLPSRTSLSLSFLGKSAATTGTIGFVVDFHTKHGR